MPILVVPIMRGRETENDERRVWGKEKYPARKPGQDEHDCFSRGWLNTRGNRWPRAGPVWRWLRGAESTLAACCLCCLACLDTARPSLPSPWLPRTQVEAHPHVKHKHTPSRLRGLRPVAYPCRAIHANHRLGPRVVDWTSGRRTCRTSFSKRAPMYQCTSVPGSHPTPLSPEPKRSPMSPKWYPGIPVPPPPPLYPPAHAMGGLSLAGPGALLGGGLEIVLHQGPADEMVAGAI